jgi:anti-sigma B factor antagonist
MGTPGFSVRADCTGPAVCVYVAGEVDIATADRLRDSVAAAVAAQPITRLVIDLSEVTFCDSSGLSALVDAHRSCQERGAALILHRPSARVRTTLTFSGLAEYFTIEP